MKLSVCWFMNQSVVCKDKADQLTTVILVAKRLVINNMNMLVCTGDIILLNSGTDPEGNPILDL